MVSTQTLIQLLADGKYHSGAELGKQLKVSRAAVWKVIQKIESELALPVYAVKGKGYRLQHALELLDKNQILENISKTTKKQLSTFDIVFDIDSTNQYLNKKSIEGAVSGYVVLAEQQTQGQGRRGRTWVSPFGGNLYLSLLWRFQDGPAQLGCLSLFIAVAIIRALNQVGVKDAGVKWPNDIYWQGKKLAGILLEMRGEVNGPSAVVIGVGVNINMSTEMTQNNVNTTSDITQPWIDLDSITEEKVSRNKFAALVINSLFDVLNAVPDKQKELLEEWQSMDVLKGEDVDVYFADKVIRGKASGITPQGALKVLADNKEVICHSGEVSIRRIK